MDIKQYKEMQDLCINFAHNVSFSHNKPMTDAGKKINKLGDQFANGELPMIIDVLTFDEFVDYGKRAAESLVEGIPWAFKFYGCNVTHDTDSRYLIPHKNGDVIFKKEEVLVVFNNGNFKVYTDD